MLLASWRCRLLVPLLCALLIGAEGCSFVFMERVTTSHDPSRAPRCTPNNGTVIADGVFGGLYLVSAAQVAGEGNGGERAGALVGVALGAVLALSAIMHMDDAERCRRAIDTHNQWVADGAGR